MSIYERIRRRRQELELSQEDLAKKVGYTSRSSIAKIESGHVDLPQSKIVEFAHALDTTVGYLMGNTDKNLGILHPTFSRVPVLGVIACGEPILAQENVEGYANVADIRCDFALRCAGDSMAPTFLDGDLVLLRSQADVDDGQIAAVVIEGEATLKRVQHVPDGLLLIPENHAYKTLQITLTEASDVRIVGLALGYQRLL